MKRRHWFQSLLAFGSLPAAVGIKGAQTARKTDLGIPPQIDAATPLSEHMVVHRHNGTREVPVDDKRMLFLAVDTERGEATVWDVTSKGGRRQGTDIFRSSGRLDMAQGPRVIRGDFRVRWRDGIRPE